VSNRIDAENALRLRQEFAHFFPGGWKPRLRVAKPPFGGFLPFLQAGESPAKAGFAPP